MHLVPVVVEKVGAKRNRQASDLAGENAGLRDELEAARREANGRIMGAREKLRHAARVPCQQVHLPEGPVARAPNGRLAVVDLQDCLRAFGKVDPAVAVRAGRPRDMPGDRRFHGALVVSVPGRVRGLAQPQPGDAGNGNPDRKGRGRRVPGRGPARGGPPPLPRWKSSAATQRRARHRNMTTVPIVSCTTSRRAHFRPRRSR